MILAVLSSGGDRFQSIVLACLVLTYLSLSAAFRIQMRTQAELAVRSGLQFLRLATLLKDPDVDAYQRQHEEAQQQVKATTTRFWIGAAFITIGWLAALFSLFSHL